MKKVYLILLMTIMSLSLFCQIHWTKYAEPVLDAGPEGSWDDQFVGSPCVLLINDTLHMWYAGAGSISDDFMSIGHATSTDGITWEKDILNPVLSGGGEGSWDKENVYVPNVLFHDTIYYMWYNGNDGNGERICMATSSDGRNWTKHPDNPVLDAGESGSWDSKTVGPGSVYYDTAFHFWYSGSNGDVFKSGYATSQDGIHWNKHPDNPVLESVSAADWDYPRVQNLVVVHENSMFHGWYCGGEILQWEIGYVSSTDGINWDRHENNPVLRKGKPGEWDEGFVAFISILYNEADSKFRMWYTGGKGEDQYSHKIGYAESVLGVPDGTDKHETHQVNIYPNPAGNFVFIQSERPAIHTIDVSSVSGQILYSKTMTNGEYRVDLSSFMKGVYFITIRSKDFVTTRKIIKM